MKYTYLLSIISILLVTGSCKKTSVHSLSTTKPRSVINWASTDIPVTSVAASSQLWPASALDDSDSLTIWSSNVHSNINSTEWVAYWFNGFHNVNYIKVFPRYNATGALGFPVKFDIYWSNGSSWVHSRSDTAFPTPLADWVILPLPATVNANGIQIVATQLGKDDVNNIVFQLGEVGAGYDTTLSHFTWLGNNNTYQQNEIRSVGSGAFNPNKISNWNYDARNPIITANTGGNSNVYAPNVVSNGGAWNIYFGGWDGTTDGHDRISITVSNDNFLTFNPHALMISNGVMVHSNLLAVHSLSEFCDFRFHQLVVLIAMAAVHGFNIRAILLVPQVYKIWLILGAPISRVPFIPGMDEYEFYFVCCSGIHIH